jgi:hypothetical protein
MTESRRENDEEALGRLLSALPPPPEGWVEAAAALPATRRDAERIIALVEADQEFRDAAVEDLEAALQRAGYEPTDRLLAEVRARLERD